MLPKNMKIIFVAPKYNYGNPKRGMSFEYHNFWPLLKKQAKYFAIDQKLSRKKLNQELLSLSEKEKPDLLFCVLFTDEIKKETIKKISQSRTTTFNWFCDDNWRYDIFSKFYAPCFNYVSTTYKEPFKKYNNAIKTQWAANNLVYKPVKSSNEYNITFVGKAHSNRKKIINYLIANGLTVDCYGEGWPNGRVSQEKMLEIFSNSKINLSFAESSFNFNKRFLAKKLFYRRLDGSHHWQKHINFKKPSQQIKARNFEIPACGGFLLAQYVPGLEEYFKLNKEIVAFKDKEDLAKEIKYYLYKNKEREAIARAGYERTLREHTYQKRFNQIFQAMQLPKLG